MQQILYEKIIFIVFFVYFSAEKVNNFVQKINRKVEKLEEKMVEEYGNRCIDKFKNCKKQSINLCDGTGKRSCIENFPDLYSNNCLTQGILASRESGIILYDDRSEILTNEEKQFICVSTSLEEVFQDNYSDNDKDFTYQFFGSSTGLFRVMPALTQEQFVGKCYDYDPRQRPWYSAAIAGGKNIIILVDTTKSMEEELERVKKTLSIIVQTMSLHDRVAVITFDSERKVLNNEQFLQAANIAYKKGLQGQIQKINISNSTGRTNYSEAFQKAFSILDKSLEQYSTEYDSTIFILISDGERSSETFQSLKSLIQKGIQSINDRYGRQLELNLLSYKFQVNDDDSDLLKNLSCQFKGIRIDLDNTKNDVNELETYLFFLSNGVKVDTSVWSEQYVDLFSGKQIFTVTKPVYYSKDNKTKLLGVVGIDVPAGKISDEDRKKLNRQPKAFESNLDEADLQQLRCKEDSSCNLQCTQKKQLFCVSDVNVFKEPSDKSQPQNICFQLSNQPSDQSQLSGLQLGLIIGGCVIFAILLIGFVYWRCRPPPLDRTTKSSKPETERSLADEAYYNKAKNAGIVIHKVDKFP